MSQKIRIKLKSYDHNLVDKSAEKIVKTKDGESYGSSSERAYTSTYSQTYLHGKPLDFRKQKIERAIRVVFVQASYRHLQLYGQDGRRPDEVGIAQRSRCRN